MKVSYGGQVFNVMIRRPVGRIVRAAVGSAAVLALAAACSDSPGPGGDPSATSNPAPTSAPAVATTPFAPATSGRPSADYTKPPSRNLVRPPGVARISGSTCTYAITDVHVFAASWASNQVKRVRAGQRVSDATWAETATVTDRYHAGIAETRSKLKGAGVPDSFVIYSDLAEADAAISEAVAAAKAKDDSRVLSIYIKSRTAEDHLVESCSALE